MGQGGELRRSIGYVEEVLTQPTSYAKKNPLCFIITQSSQSFREDFFQIIYRGIAHQTISPLSAKVTLEQNVRLFHYVGDNKIVIPDALRFLRFRKYDTALRSTQQSFTSNRSFGECSSARPDQGLCILRIVTTSCGWPVSLSDQPIVALLFTERLDRYQKQISRAVAQ